MSSTGAGYDQSPTTYSPDGRIYQVEYAQKAVDNAGTAVGVRCVDGIVLGVEKLVLSKMLIHGSNRRIHTVAEHVGVATAGVAGDARTLALQAQRECGSWKSVYGEPIVPEMLATRMGSYLHYFTCWWDLRPYGASVIIGGYDFEKKNHELYLADPAGNCFRYFGVALGKGARAAKTEIEKAHFESRTCAEALKLVAKILHRTREEMKDKPCELELSWLCEATGWRHEHAPEDLIRAADEDAKRELAAEEMGSDDDGDDEDM